MKSRTYMKILFAFLFFLTLTLVSYAQDSGIKERFLNANLLYKENKYTEAIAAYEAILQQGFESGNLYYNLGNSYFKQGALGKAILNYERAKQFIPRDSDLKANYEYARSLLALGSEEPSQSWYLKWMDRLSSGITIDCLGLFLLAVQALFFLALIAIMASKASARPYRLMLTILVMIIVTGGVVFKRKADFASRGAIVIAKEVPSKFEPLESATTHFTLTEGGKVEVIETSGAWRKIKRFDNKAGWVEEQAIEFISQNN